MPLITISCLGKKGRAGNAMFQFSFAMGYAKAMGCELQTNDWWGRRVFPAAAELPLINKELPSTHCDSITHYLKLPLGYFIGMKDINLDGYFQHNTFIDFYTRKQVREWFKLKAFLNELSPFERGCDPYSAQHLRRGDYTTDPTFQRLYCTVSDESYAKAIEQFNIPAPVLSIYDGWNAPVKYTYDMGVPWLEDWLVLRDAAHLLRSNSTFAWWAAAIGHGKVYSPVVEDKVGLQTVPFVEGNHPNTAGIFKNQSDLHLREE